MNKKIFRVDEDDIKILFLGDPSEQAQGLELVNSLMRDGVMALVEAINPGLQPDDLPDVWSETLVSLWKKVSEGNFDENGPLIALVRLIAMRRANDIYKNKSEKKRRPVWLILKSVFLE